MIMLNLFHKDNSEAPVAGLVKLIVTLAADAHASKIVLGEPCEAGFQRIPLVQEPIPPCPWEEEDRTRFRGCGETELPKKTLLEQFFTNDRAVSKKKPCGIPLWFKFGDTFEETTPLPAIVFLDMLAVMKSWNQRKISSEGENAQWDKIGDIPLESTDEAVLSSFLLKLKDGRVIHVLFGFEADFRLSITLNDTGKTI